MASLGFFQTLQFATDIHDYAGKLRANRIERPRDAVLGGDDLVAQGRRVERSPRRDRPEGASADQFAVTLGLR